MIRLPRRSSVVFWGFLACLVALTFVRIDLHARGTAQAATVVAAPELEADTMAVVVPVLAPAPPAPVAGPADRVRHVIVDTLGRDGSIYLSLKHHRLPELEIARVGHALTPVFDAQRESKPGDVFRLELDSLRAVLRFEYTPVREPERPVLVERRGQDLVGRRRLLPMTEETAAVEVIIEDNLYNALAAAGAGDALTDMIVDRVFASVIDFHKQTRAGDRLGVVFTRLSIDDRFVRYGDVLLARYEGQVVSQVGVHYEDPSGNADYYDEDGNSLERLFLLYPMEFRRISSRFARRRFHPILKRNLPHLGTDYAAARGTPVWATARGRVIFAGWNGGYGKMVEVEHANGFRTRYAHLSRILVSKGRRLDRWDHIGHVGATGRATGPHLHYELIQNGRHIDPGTVNRGDGGRPLGSGYRAAFAARYQALTDRLEAVRAASGVIVADAGLDRGAGGR